MSKFRSLFRPIILKYYRGFSVHGLSRLIRLSKLPSKNNRLASLAFISIFLTANPEQYNPNNHFDAEKQISQLITQAEECILKDKLAEAKTILNNALKLADEKQAYGSLSYLCDLLSSIVLSQGELVEAEKLLVQFTEKLLQLGYPETHNSVVKFKLKISRLYQMLASNEMAEYGFRDCIAVQESKMKNLVKLDDEANSIYMTALFWYGKLMADQKDFSRAKRLYSKCLERISKTPDILPSQKMVVLHSIAGVSAGLKEYDAAIIYLLKAIEICASEDPNNPDLPIYIVQIGMLYLQKKVYEGALYWCQTGLSLATQEGNKFAEEQGQDCIEELKKLKIV